MHQKFAKKLATSQAFEDRDVYFYITIYKLPGIYQKRTIE